MTSKRTTMDFLAYVAEWLAAICLIGIVLTLGLSACLHTFGVNFTPRQSRIFLAIVVTWIGVGLPAFGVFKLLQKSKT